MICPNCGFENHVSARSCASCGARLETRPAPASDTRRSCVSCGRTIPFDANVCPYCGHDYMVSRQARPEPHAHISTGMKVVLYVLSLLIPLAGIIIGVIYYSKPEPENKEVGKICLIIGIVMIIILPVILAAVLYWMVLGFGAVDGQPPASNLTKSTVQNGVKFTFLPFTKDTEWDDITIMLSDGLNAVTWSPSTTELGEGTGSVQHFSSRMFGTFEIWMNVTDLSGNGYVNMGDFFTFTTGSTYTFSASTTYTVTIIWDPSASKICDLSFTG